MSISHETTYSEGPKSSYDTVHARNLETLTFCEKFSFGKNSGKRDFKLLYVVQVEQSQNQEF